MIGIISLTKNLGQYDRLRVLGCEPIEGVLLVLSSNQINIASFVHQMETRTSSIWWTNIAIFNGFELRTTSIIWFELRTTSTPSTGSHPSTLGLSYWPKFFIKDRTMDLVWTMTICLLFQRWIEPLLEGLYLREQPLTFGIAYLLLYVRAKLLTFLNLG